VVTLKNVCKNYNGKTVLENVNLTLEQTTGLMGQSGIGKTTLLNIIAGLVKPDTGEITGIESKKISFVFQEDRLLEEETALKNLLFVSADKERAISLLTQAGLAESLHKKTAKLSGGMKRRVCICRALIADYDVLLMDEPFKGLDEEIKLKTMHMVKDNLRENATVLLVTHDQAEADFFGGKVVKF